jgi:hypothetical protein
MRINNDKQNMQKMQATIAASWATYRRMRKDGVIGDVPLKLTPMRKEDQLVKYGDENGLIFAPTSETLVLPIVNISIIGRYLIPT